MYDVRFPLTGSSSTCCAPRRRRRLRSYKGLPLSPTLSSREKLRIRRGLRLLGYNAEDGDFEVDVLVHVDLDEDIDVGLHMLS